MLASYGITPYVKEWGMKLKWKVHGYCKRTAVIKMNGLIELHVKVQKRLTPLGAHFWNVFINEALLGTAFDCADAKIIAHALVLKYTGGGCMFEKDLLTQKWSEK